ncbi:hypothetical protein SAMN05421594_4110 [Chryseobacterium oleae]|uniref:C-type lectin domain-containing protein n=1 Tax=Chryseobacterium oleae TaxID=491207 RepID=A0A1I5BQ56_CHROL|nr:hypothetical protein [Chryseobacterium oleae]SFN76736.1 hypothetical protein SAMN05421594_4110 [Chryseobacterium oleae]
MKKRLFLIIPVLFSAGLYSQIGINNQIPKATLDITAKKTDGTTAEGLIPPRLTGNQIKAADNLYGADQKGTIIYATAPVGVTSTKTANISSEGYYYFDGNIWQKIVSSTTVTNWGLNGNTGTTASTSAIGTDANNNFIGTKDTNDLVLVSNKKEVMRMNTNQQVLLGTLTVPAGGTSAKVIINNGTTAGAIQIKDGTQKEGKFLGSDDNGTATWKDVSKSLSVTTIVDPNVLGYVPSNTSTAATSAPASLALGTTTATLQGITTFNGHSYAAYSTAAAITWYQAYTASKNMGGYLASFTSDNEWKHVEGQLLTPKAIFNTNGGWIGFCKFDWLAGTALTPNPEMKWITGEQPLHDYSYGGTTAVRKQNWFSPSQPDNSSNSEGFVHFQSKNANLTVTFNSYTTTHPWNDVPSNTGSITTGGGFIVEFQQ